MKHGLKIDDVNSRNHKLNFYHYIEKSLLCYVLWHTLVYYFLSNQVQASALKGTCVFVISKSQICLTFV